MHLGRVGEVAGDEVYGAGWCTEPFAGSDGGHIAVGRHQAAAGSSDALGYGEADARCSTE